MLPFEECPLAGWYGFADPLVLQLVLRTKYYFERTRTSEYYNCTSKHHHKSTSTHWYVSWRGRCRFQYFFVGAYGGVRGRCPKLKSGQIDSFQRFYDLPKPQGGCGPRGGAEIEECGYIEGVMAGTRSGGEARRRGAAARRSGGAGRRGAAAVRSGPHAAAARP